MLVTRALNRIDQALTILRYQQKYQRPVCPSKKEENLANLNRHLQAFGRSPRSCRASDLSG